MGDEYGDSVYGDDSWVPELDEDDAAWDYRE